MMRIVSAADAWSSLRKSDKTRWKNNISRFDRSPVEIEHEPKFKITNEDTFFCIGSCFARNLEEHLIYSDRNVLSKKIICPANEWPARINGFVNKFTSHSMLNEIEWVLSPPPLDESLFEGTASGWLDLQLCPGTSPVSLDRAIERRAYLINDYFSRLRDASVVILTLGLNEVWHDARCGKYLNATPSLYGVRRDPERYSLEITDVDDNLNALEQIKVALAMLNPDAKIVVTVSPVPLSETFSGRDVAVANTLSKATLRVAAEMFSIRHASVDYYPTFDMISLSPRHAAYTSDCLHVTDQTVGKVMSDFLRLYLGEDVSPVSFSENAYLRANPDVEAAVRLGQVASGFEHWVSRGREETRRVGPGGGPTASPVHPGAA